MTNQTIIATDYSVQLLLFFFLSFFTNSNYYSLSWPKKKKKKLFFFLLNKKAIIIITTNCLYSASQNHRRWRQEESLKVLSLSLSVSLLLHHCSKFSTNFSESLCVVNLNVAQTWKTVKNSLFLSELNWVSWIIGENGEFTRKKETQF